MEDKFRNFRIDKTGHVEFYVGWCNLEEDDIESLKYVLAKLQISRLENIAKKGVEDSK